MMHRFIKKTAIVIFAVLLFSILCMSVFAARQMPDVARTDCSITLSYFDKNGAPIQGGGFTLYHVASVKNDDNDLSHDTAGTAFANSGITVDSLESNDLAQKLALYAERNKLTGITKSIAKNGELKYKNLTIGLYLIVQTKAIPGYYSINPFLVTVPITDKDSDKWIYHVNASLKSKVNPRPTDKTNISVKKIWTDDGKNRPKSVAVQLRRGDVAYEEIFLSDQNNWEYTWSNLDGAYSWSVREINVPDGYVASYRTIGTEIFITNTSTLIQTGQLNWPIPLLAGIGVVLFVAGWIITFAAKEKKHK